MILGESKFQQQPHSGKVLPQTNHCPKGHSLDTISDL